MCFLPQCLGATIYQQIKSQHTNFVKLLPRAATLMAVKDKHQSLLLQMPYATAGEFLCWYIEWVDREREGVCCLQSTGLLAVHSPGDPLSSQFVVALSASHIGTVGIYTVNQ